MGETLNMVTPEKLKTELNENNMAKQYLECYTMQHHVKDA